MKFVCLISLIAILAATNSECKGQSAVDYYNSAKTTFENGNSDDCLLNLRNCEASLGGSNAKIEALKCQALMMKGDWVNAAIAYTNYERLLPNSAQNGEAYMAMLDFKKEIWSQLDQIEKKKKEEQENEIKEDLAEAIQEEEQQETSNATKLERINKTNEKQLFQLAMQSKDKILLELYKKEVGATGANFKKVTLEIDKKNNPAAYLADAIQQDDIEEFKYLLSVGGSSTWTNTQGESLLHIAIVNDAFKVFKHLLVLKADIEQPDNAGHTPLIKAIIKSKTEFVKLLLANGANHLQQNKNNHHPPFYYAVINSNSNIGDLLIKKGVNPNESFTIDREQVAPLYIVADKTRSKDFADFLINNGARINELSAKGLSPLMAAVNNKDKDFVNFLLNRGADINLAGKDKQTALHLAVKQRDADMVTYLIQRGGARKKASDALGRTPLELAKKQQDKNIAKAIKKNKSFVKLSSAYTVREEQYLQEVERREKIRLKRIGRADRFFYTYAYDTLCKYGISIGTINNRSIGMYVTARMNKDGFTSTSQNGEIKDGKVVGGQYDTWGNDWRYKNVQKTGNIEGLIGITKKVAYPLWLYLGAGVSYSKTFWEMEIYDNNGDYSDTDWVLNSDESAFKPVVETGAIIDLKGFNIRGGVKTQDFKTVAFTAGIGFSLAR